jgi:hypothetical protein
MVCASARSESAAALSASQISGRDTKLVLVWKKNTASNNSLTILLHLIFRYHGSRIGEELRFVKKMIVSSVFSVCHRQKCRT